MWKLCTEFYLYSLGVTFYRCSLYYVKVRMKKLNIYNIYFLIVLYNFYPYLVVSKLCDILITKQRDLFISRATHLLFDYNTLLKVKRFIALKYYFLQKLCSYRVFYFSTSHKTSLTTVYYNPGYFIIAEMNLLVPLDKTFNFTLVRWLIYNCLITF